MTARKSTSARKKATAKRTQKRVSKKSSTKKRATKKPVARKATKKPGAKKKTPRAKTQQSTAKQRTPRANARQSTARKKAAGKQATETTSLARDTAKAPPPAPAPSPSVAPAKPPSIAAGNPRRVGVVTHFYPHAGAGVVAVNASELRVGDTVHIRGHTTDYYQRVDRIELDHATIEVARVGQVVGLHVSQRVREGDRVSVVSS